MDDYFWIQEHRRQKRRGERDEVGIDDALADGFAMLADDDLVIDEPGVCGISSHAELLKERENHRLLGG